MKIGIAGITQESNTFAPSFSSLRDFSIESGSRVISVNRGTNTEVGGFLDGLESLGEEAVPLFSAWAVSAGPVEDLAFESLTGLLVKEVKKHSLDGLLLALHGAWLSRSYPSADAEAVRRVRDAIGPKAPIVVTVDSHANITPPLFESIQGLVGYRTYPHVDMAETGVKAARLLLKILIKDLKPHLYWLPVPLLAPPQSATTDQAPIRDVLLRLDRELPFGETLSSSLFYVQPWLDMEGVNSSLVAVTRSESAKTAAILGDIANELWSRRGEFGVAWTSPDDLVAEVLREKSRPVIVSEAFDGTSGGAPGDNPGLLSVLLPHKNKLSACLSMVDPGAAQRMSQAGPGAEFEGTLGAYSDRRFGPPLAVKGRIRHITNGEFVLKGPVFTGRKLCMGLSAVLELGKLSVVVSSQPVFTIDPELYRSQGIEPESQDVVAVKSPTLFRPGYAAMLKRVIHLDMPGVCRGNLIKVPFHRVQRPIWPLDQFSWDESRRSAFCFGPHGGRRPG